MGSTAPQLVWDGPRGEGTQTGTVPSLSTQPSLVSVPPCPGSSGCEAPKSCLPHYNKHRVGDIGSPHPFSCLKSAEPGCALRDAGQAWHLPGFPDPVAQRVRKGKTMVKSFLHAFQTLTTTATDLNKAARDAARKRLAGQSSSGRGGSQGTTVPLPQCQLLPTSCL